MQISKKLWIVGVTAGVSSNAPFALNLQERLALGDKFASTLTVDAMTCAEERVPLSLDLPNSNLQIDLKLVGSRDDKGYHSAPNIVLLDSVTRTEVADEYGNRSFCIAKFSSPMRAGTKILGGRGPIMRACPFYELQLIVDRMEYERLTYHAQTKQFFEVGFTHIPRSAEESVLAAE